MESELDSGKRPADAAAGAMAPLRLPSACAGAETFQDTEHDR